MKKLSVTLAAIAVVAAGITGPAATAAAAAAPDHRSPRNQNADQRTTLERDAQRLVRLGAPGVVAQVSTPSGATQLRAGYGNLSRRTPVPWNARFRIASMTKPFVATVVLQLVGENRVSLDDSVEDYLPRLVRGQGNDGRTITIRDLLQQTSGLPDYLQNVDVFTKPGFKKHRFDTVTARQAVKLAMKSKRLFAPGSAWGYSNTNYALAGLIIHDVTGHSWRREVRERVAKPLGLRHTYAPRTNSHIPGPNATAYERFPGPDATAQDPQYGKAVNATRLNPSWAGAAGGIISTPEDANTFLRALIKGRLLDPAQMKQMQKTVPTDKAFRQSWPGSRYGLGLMWIPNSCGGSWSHGGDIQGFMTRNGVTPDGKRSVVVSMNTDSPIPGPGTRTPKHEMTRTLIDHALCGN